VVASDREWYARIKAGDESAFEALFRAHYGVLCGFARKFVADKDTAEELVQELFMQMWDRRATLNPETSLKAYLFTAIRNSCLNHLKHLAVKSRHQEHARSMEAAHAADPSEALQSAELEARIHLEIDALPDRCSEIFKLSRFQGLKYDEIAKELGISPRTVEVQIGKALKILRENLAEWLPMLLFLLAVEQFLMHEMPFPAGIFQDLNFFT
jgi:RNA polymerase sigma-70 factor (family 1)